VERYVKDLRTVTLLPGTIDRVDDVAWATDSRTFFYVTEDAVTKRHDKFWRRVVGTDTSDLVYDEKDELFDLGCLRTRDRAAIVLDIAAKTSTEVRYLPADRPAAGSGSSFRDSRITSTTSTTQGSSFTLARTRAQRTFGSSRRRTPIRLKRTGRRSWRTGRR
jgi:protease II